MASRKDYTYQIKGNKLSLLERDQTSGTGLNYVYAGVDGDGVMDGTTSGSISLTSPVTDVSEGIELEYAYSPLYNVPPKNYSGGTYGLVGWTSVDGYLTFIGYNQNWVTSTIAANEHIYIGDSGIWTGLHKVQEVQNDTGSHGGIKTYTKVKQPLLYFTDTVVTWIASGSQLVSVGGEDNFESTFISPTNVPYLSISGGDPGDKDNVGLFSGWSMLIDGSGESLDFGSATQYKVDGGVYSTAAADFNGDTSSPVYIREAFYDNSYVVSDVNNLSDESDEIDISSYLSKALVYYVKGKLAEDQMNIEAKEYMMREFRRMLEKHESSKVAGPRGVMTGSHSIR